MSLPMAVSMIRIRSDETNRHDTLFIHENWGRNGMISTSIDLDYLISNHGLCISCNDLTLTMKSICVRHAIQVSEMNSRLPIFKSTIAFLHAGNPGWKGWKGCLGPEKSHEPVYGLLIRRSLPSTPQDKVQSMIGTSKLLLLINFDYFKVYPDTGRSFGYIMILHCLPSNLPEDEYTKFPPLLGCIPSCNSPRIL